MPILNMNYSVSGSWGGNIWEPLNLTVTSIGLDATIKWEDNEIWTIPPTTFQKSELVRKVGSAPTSPSDWTLVVTETVKDTYKVSGYTDSWLTDWTTYYYRVFSYSDLGGISYCDAVSVTPTGWWQPWINTLAYYPLDTDFNDYSSTGADLTNTWWTITTIDGVTCAYYDWGDYSQNTTLPSLTWTRTLSCRRRPASTSGVMWVMVSWYVTYENLKQRWIQQSSWVMRWSEWVTLEQSVSSWISVTAWNWYHVVTTIENWTTAKIYVNGVLCNTVTRTDAIQSWQWICIWARASNTHSEKANWYVSEAIVEWVAWTQQEVLDYFNQTKANYGYNTSLPAEYQQVEYIEATWTQWINTWVKASNTLSTYLVMRPNMSYTSENCIFWDAWSLNAIFFMEYQGTYRFHNGWNSADTATITDDKTTVTTTNLWITVNGVSYSISTNNSYTNNNIWLWAVWSWSNTSDRWHFKVYSFSMYNNWIPVREFIPCYRKLDSVIWMYDMVNDVFYTNSWSWTFTKWNDV